MTIPVFFRHEMSVRTTSFSPSASKPELAVLDWRESKLDIALIPFKPLKPSDIATAHSPIYVNGVMRGMLANGFGNADQRVARSLLFTCGSMTAAALHVAKRMKEDGVVTAACSPSSGFHHAHYEGASGYCTFNGLVIAAQQTISAGLAQRVAIIDYDYHFADGTWNIIETLGLSDRIFHFTAGEHYRQRSEARRMIDTIWRPLTAAKEFGCNLVLYQAGADQHRNDPLGGLLTNRELAERDRMVFELCAQLKLPVAWNLAGGYQAEPNGTIPKVLTIHRNTMKECIKVFSDQKETV